MDQMGKRQNFDLDVRHYIYKTFAETAYPPTVDVVGKNLKASLVEVEKTFERLADAHHIALAPGSYSVWMAHPFSGIPTNYVAKVSGKKYWGN